MQPMHQQGGPITFDAKLTHYNPEKLGIFFSTFKMQSVFISAYKDSQDTAYDSTNMLILKTHYTKLQTNVQTLIFFVAI